MRQLVNGRTVGEGFLVSGRVAEIRDTGTTIEFCVSTDGVLRTVVMDKAVAAIRITKDGITITEEKRNA